MKEDETLAKAVAGGALATSLVDVLVRKGVLDRNEIVAVFDDAVSKISRDDAASLEAFSILTGMQVAFTGNAVAPND